MQTLEDSFPVPLVRLSQTDSTNRYLNEWCEKELPKPFTTVAADYQNSGRGQRGNSWESEKDQNLLFSFILYPSFLEARHQFLLSQLISLAIKEELDTYSEGFSIKWPNDVYWHKQKVCGILIENTLSGKYLSQAIVGIGLNVNQTHFISDAPNPISLKQITGEEVDRYTLLAHLMRRIQTVYLEAETGIAHSIDMRYQAALFRKEGMHRYRDAQGEFLARILRVEPDGPLILEDEQGQKRSYLFKEIQYIPE